MVEAPSLNRTMTKLPVVSITLKQFNQESTLTKLTLNSVLIDSGTSDCLVSSDALYNAPLLFSKLPTELSLSNALNQKSDNVIRKTLNCNIHITESNITLVNATFYVVEKKMQFDAILGMSVLRRLVVDFRTKSLKLCDVWSNNLTIVDHDDFAVKVNNLSVSGPHVICGSDSVVGPYEECYIPCKAVLVDKFTDSDEFMAVPDQQLSLNALSVWPKFSKTRNLIKLKNFSDRAVYLEKGAVLGKLKGVTEENLIPDKELTRFCNFLVKTDSLSEKEQKAHSEELKVWKRTRNKLVSSVNLKSEYENICKSVPDRFSSQMREFFQTFDWNFSRSSNDAGLSQHYVVDLVLKPGDSQVPSFSRPYKTDPTVAKLLQAKIDDMKSAGILESANSAWNSPVLSVKKKCGNLRVVNNFSSALNQRLLSGHFPLTPMRVLFKNISEFLTKIQHKYPGQKVLMTSLDVRNGYFSLSLKRDKRDLTAFIIGSEQLRYRRLSQGLALAPSDFSQFMRSVFSDICDKNDEKFLIVNYLDDYAIMAPEQTHMEALTKVFEKIKSHNLIIALNKCVFMKDSMKFLGFLVTQDGFEVEKSRVQALISLPDPRTKKEALQYMASFNFFMRCVPKMGFLFKPLCNATTLPKFALTDQIQQSLATLREKIKAGIGVAHLSYEKPVFLCVDSSLTAVGFALGNFNFVDGQPKNVSWAHFGSYFFEKCERYFSSRSRELLGLSHALTSFSDLLPVSLEFHCFTDHQSLERIATKADLGKTSFLTRIRQAYSIVLNYPRMIISHLPGKSPIMELADGISRLTWPRPERLETAEFDPDVFAPSVESNVLAFDKPTVSRDKIAEEQATDSFVSKIRVEMSELQKSRIIRNNVEFVKVRGLIYQKSKETNKLLLIIPEILSYDILNYLHVSNFHRGGDSLKQALLREPILIRNRTRLISEIVRTCLYCQLSNPAKFRDKNQDMPIRPTLRPFEKVSIDLFHLSSGDRNLYLLTFYDCFSTFLDAEVLKGKNGRDVAKKLALLIIRNGCQQNTQYLSDNGLEFCNSHFNQLMSDLNCYVSRISPYNSRSSMVERCHRELRSYLRNMTNLGDMEFQAKICVGIYNNQVRKSLGNMSPREVLTGISPPLLLAALDGSGQGRDEVGQEEGQEELSTSRSEWSDYVRAAQLAVGVDKFVTYNSFLKPKNQNKFEVNDLVLIVDPLNKISKNWSDGIKGPFIVTGRNMNSYTVRHLIDNRTFTRNARHLRHLRLSEKNSKILKDHSFVITDENLIKPIPPEVDSETDLKVEGLIRREDPVVRSEYSLRPRKSKV